MIDKTDRLRTPETVFQEDERQTYFSVLNIKTGETRPKTLADHYARVARLKLDDSVPDNIQTHFETAKNLLLYSWFVYGFISVAEMQAYASTEYALRERIGDKARKGATLRPLLNYALKTGLIDDDGFSHYSRLKQQRFEVEQTLREIIGKPALTTQQIDSQEYCRVLVETFPSLRNVFAHGTSSLMPDPYLRFDICRDLINQLFRPR